ncbi:MAG: beta-galactosidase [Opitutales bacterium]|nr:beta-galactosidase [Opitutales bacterium]MCH8541725.1 beta-galactosidase [Opitutales bacterium]
MATPPSHLRPLNLNRFLFGVCYYPEHWDEATRADDIKRMQDAGIEVIRLAEFAASLIEPRPFEYQFAFFDDIIGSFGEAGIQTILGTPTAAPPRWLTRAHPDAVAVDAKGRRMQHGSRQHISLSHPAYRDYARRISAAMAKHYASFPEVIGWQTDNEYHCHFAEDHSEAAEEEFQLYLKEKYSDSIDQLNRSWGNVFWSLTYDTFADIPTPKQESPAYPNPSHQLDYARFLSWRATRVQREQIAAIRQAKRPDWFIFHNGCFGKIDYRGEFGEDLDFLGYDSYPMFSYAAEPRPAMHAFNLDRTRSWTGNFIIPEHQSGPGGQGNYFHDQPEPGEIRKMTYTSMAHGADGILYFRWRTCRFGAEMYWCGILDHDNQPRRRFSEIQQIGREMKTLGPALLGSTVRIEVGVAMADYTAQEAHETLPQGLPSPSSYAETLHGWFYQQHYAVGCVHPTDNLRGLQLFLIPHWEVIDPLWIEPLTRFVAEGGTLVIGARSGTRCPLNHVLPSPPPGHLAELAGVEVMEYSRKNMAEERFWKLRWGDREMIAEDWVEILQPQAGTQTLAKWTTRHARGTAAITQRQIGKGNVIYVGCAMTSRWIETYGPTLAEICQLKPVWPNLPKEVEMLQRENTRETFWFIINHTDTPQSLPSVPQGETLAGPAAKSGIFNLEAYGVAVIRTAKTAKDSLLS